MPGLQEILQILAGSAQAVVSGRDSRCRHFRKWIRLPLSAVGTEEDPDLKYQINGLELTCCTMLLLAATDMCACVMDFSVWPPRQQLDGAQEPAPACHVMPLRKQTARAYQPCVEVVMEAR